MTKNWCGWIVAMCLVAGSAAPLEAGHAEERQAQKTPAQVAEEQKDEARKAAEEDRRRAAQEDRNREKEKEAAEARRAAEERKLARQIEIDRRALVPLSVQVVVSRYQGDKRMSNLPYTLAVNAVAVNAPDAKPSQLRMGAKVPVPSVPKGPPAGPGTVPPPGPFSFNYQDIGTNIDCNARVTDDGRFQLLISIDDTSVYTNVADASTPTVGDMPVFRSFRSTNTLVLRDGQTRQFTAATDRVSGEVVRIDVTLSVVK